ncbi:MAG: glycosyltransferase family A protein [Hyphomicrobiaceae bacterium]|nr:glycosyltransferase family A protein [Hyphomicrobiaceae bacterium]
MKREACEPRRAASGLLVAMRISVFITSYNQAHLLPEAIASVLAQTRPAAEIVIVDDASTDGSRALIDSYASAHPRLIKALYHETNTGVAQTRIDALSAVTGDHVTYVDGDDRFLPDKLAREAAALLADPAASIAYSNTRYMSEDFTTPVHTWVDGEAVPQGDVFLETFTRSFPRRSLFRMELVRTADWRRIGFHDPNLQIYEDFDMRIRLTKHLKTVYVDNVGSEIRTHQSGLSKLPDDRHLACLSYLYRKSLPLLADLPAERARDARRRLACWILRIGARATVGSARAGRPVASARSAFATGRLMLEAWP